MNRLTLLLVLASASSWSCAEPALEGGGRALTTARLDRMGRPEIQNFIIKDDKNESVDGDPDVKALYNTEDVFAVRQSPNLALYRAHIAEGLALLDKLDGVSHWSQGPEDHPLTDLLIDDYLIVDTSLPCTVDSKSYLEIEAGSPDGQTTCGGRTPNDDVVDRMLRWMVAFDQASVGDGVDETGGVLTTAPGTAPGEAVAPHRATDEFPYLAEPYLATATPEPAE